MQSFIGKINFLKRFIPNLEEHLRKMTEMLKKDAVIKWTVEAKKYFESVKLALTQAPDRKSVV